MSRSLSKAQAYSRKVLPPGWRNIIIADEKSLFLFGKSNLERMLEEWKILSRAYALKLDFYKKNQPLETCMRNFKTAKQDYEDSLYAIETISRVLPEAEDKPIFATHRHFDESFPVGEIVFVVVLQDGRFTPATVLSQEARDVYIRFEEYEGKPEGKVEYDSPLLLSAGDLVYLVENPDYARFFACGSGLNHSGDVDLFLNMVEDFGIELEIIEEEPVALSDS